MAEFFAGYLPLFIAHLITALIKCALLLLIPFLGAMTFVWMERKIAGRIQDRLGPTRTGGAFGWLQLLADGIKLLTKEDLRPSAADPTLFRLAPYISFCSTYVALLPLPFSDGWVAVHLEVSVFWVLAILSVGVFGVVIAGYSSGSKWSLFGAMREAAQVVSYEIPLSICVLVPVCIYGTMDLVAIANRQAAGIHQWLIFHDPFTFVIFWVYFTCALASCSRAPFDLAEAESELVAGFHTEYSGFRWLAFYMGEYGRMFIVSGLAAILFFGGWNGPVPITSMLGLSDENHALAGHVGNLLGLLNFVIKGVIGVTFMIWVRWTLPRLRIDQVITTCLKYALPISGVMFVGALAWKWAVPA